jgi:predicted ATPase
MQIERIEITNYGPFFSPATLELEPEVTVLTGPNDVGKSSVLRLIDRICQNDFSTPAGEAEFNYDRMFDSSNQDWAAREDFGATFHVRLPEKPSVDSQNQNLTPGARAIVRASLGTRNRKRRVVQVFSVRDNSSSKGDWSFPPEWLRSVFLPPPGSLRDTIDFKTTNDLEKALLRRAFGQGFDHEGLARLSDAVYARHLHAGEEKLNAMTQRVVPSELGLTWRIRERGNRTGLSFMLQDRHGGMSALGSRGTGIRNVMGALAHLLDHDFERGQTLVLFDEPESSLHADSQHMLRRLLEGLAERPNVQVVYATHSPSMINTLRPQTIRLLRRDMKEEHATTVIDNQPFKDNFLPVRASLGITPADSLLYAPVTVVVEGDTEVVGLPLLLLKLADAGVAGFERTRLLLSQTHFLDGMGDRYTFVLRMAKSQGAKPIIFLDGDKKRHLAQHKLAETHAEVPIVTLADGQEFEQLFPEIEYFKALAEVIGEVGKSLTAEAFRHWERTANLASKMAFTKRVRRWLEDQSIDEPNKARIARGVIELSPVDQVNVAPLRELVGHIERLLRS